MTKRELEREGRMLGINGQSPTTRDKWLAFHRLWRLAVNKANMFQEQAIVECFWTLFPRTRWTSLLNADSTDGLVDRSHMPLELRKSLLEHARRRRLYGGQPGLKELDQRVSVGMANVHGIEMTPLEVAETRYQVCSLLRTMVAEQGEQLPAHDGELLAAIRKAMVSE